jgi:hypothetical protein
MEGGRIAAEHEAQAPAQPDNEQVSRLVELGRQSGLGRAADWVAEEWSRESAD